MLREVLAPKIARSEMLRRLACALAAFLLVVCLPNVLQAQSGQNPSSPNPSNLSPTGPRIDVSSATMQPASAELQAALQRRGDLVLRGSTLDAALFTINELWKVNIIAGQLEGQVNGVFKNAPLKEILDSILLGNGYGYRMVGESIVVSRLEQLGQINPFFVSEAIQVANAKPSDLVETARMLSTPQGQVQAIDSARSLIVIDFAERVKMIRELVASIDAASGGPGMLDATGRPKPVEVGYYHTQYITAASAKLVLATVLSPVGRVESVDGEDRLVVVDFAENLQMVDRILANVDRPRPQVQITALIYDLSLTDIEQLGVNWAQAVNTRTTGTAAAATQVTVSNPFSPAAAGSLFTFSHLGDNFDLAAVAQAIQSASDSRLLANPNVTVMDNEEANFEAVEQIPYQQITQTQQGGNLAGTAFKDAGIKLDVVPKIAADGTVELMVRPEFSRLTGFTPGDNQPIIDTRATSTTVRVGNGQTLVIGGMRQRSDVGDFGGVPGLKDVRWLGRMFRSRSTDIRESELVVFITPRIVGYSDPLHCRNQLVRDTIDCRLNHIPQAEGCPPAGAACGDCGDQPGMMMLETPTGPSQPESLLTPEPIEAPGPMITPQARSAAASVPGVESMVRATPRRALPRRLPPPPNSAGPNIAGASIAAAGVPPLDLSNVPVAKYPPLRQNYDARFRDAGNLHSTVPPQAEPADVSQAKSKAWWNPLIQR